MFQGLIEIHTMDEKSIKIDIFHYWKLKLIFLINNGQKMRCKIKGKMNVELDDKWDIKVDARLYVTLDSKLDAKHDTKLDVTSNAKVDRKLDAKRDSTIATNMGTKLDTILGPKLDST